MTTPTQTLAALASTLSYKRIPTIVGETTKQSLLDTVGCGIYGSQTSWVKSLTNLIPEHRGFPMRLSGCRGFAVQSIP